MIIEIIISREMIEEIPELPSVYALFSLENSLDCRHVGYTHNLRESIRAHFNPDEPNIDLRYLMLSSKTKVMYYEVESDGITEETKKKVIEWESQFQPRITMIREQISDEQGPALLLKNYRR